MTKRETRSRVSTGALSRRDVLRAGGLLLPASAVVPGLFTGISHALTLGGTFDFYISRTGSDSNAGTLASPWSINAINTKRNTYAGKRLGIIAGTYDVSAIVAGASEGNIALDICGGSSSSPTYVGSCDVTGLYSPRAATLDAKGASGSYGGSNSSRAALIGQGASAGSLGYVTIDGLKLTGAARYCVMFGSNDNLTLGPIINATLQNCEIYGNNSQSNVTASGVNISDLSMFNCSNCTVSNCYFHDNVGYTDNIHFAAIYIFGNTTQGTLIEYCTFVNSGCIYGKEANIFGSTVRNCFIDVSSKSPAGGQNMGIEGFCAAGGTGRAPSYFYNNIIIGSQGMIFECQESGGVEQWYNALYCYNNTYIINSAQGNLAPGFRFWENGGQSKLFYFYNNLIYDNGVSYGGYGYVDSNVDGFAVCDYNIYGTSNTFTTRPSGGNSGSTATTQTFAGWKTAIGGLDAHSSVSGANPFLNSGVLALKYQLPVGSPAYLAGRVGGVLSGAPCNIGAWDGILSRIGSNFGAGMVTPDAPVLTVS